MSLDAFFERLSLKVRPLAICRVADGWMLDLEPREKFIVFYVRAGEGLLGIEEKDVPLRAGHFVVVPPKSYKPLTGSNSSRSVAAGPSEKAVLAGGIRLLEAGHPPFAIDALCGEIVTEAVEATFFLFVLRQPVVADLAATPGLSDMYRSIAEELHAPRPGFWRAGRLRHEAVTDPDNA